MQETSFEELRKVHLEEKHSSLLCPLPENFYDAYLSYLEVCSETLKNNFSIEKAKVFENTRGVFLELVRLRSQKVILKAFKDCRTGATTSEDLARQETGLYLALLKHLKEYENSFSRFKPADVPEAPKSVVRLELLENLPEFVSPSGKVFGPLSKGQFLEVDEETAGLLLAKSVAKTL